MPKSGPHGSGDDAARRAHESVLLRACSHTVQLLFPAPLSIMSGVMGLGAVMVAAAAAQQLSPWGEVASVLFVIVDLWVAVSISLGIAAELRSDHPLSLHERGFFFVETLGCVSTGAIPLATMSLSVVLGAQHRTVDIVGVATVALLIVVFQIAASSRVGRSSVASLLAIVLALTFFAALVVERAVLR